MGKRVLAADYHLNSPRITKLRPQFQSQEEHDYYHLDNISKLKKNDILEVHGDFIFDKKNYDWYIEQLAKMSCRIELIFGNHDSKRLYNEPRLPRLIPQLPLYCKDNIWMSHAPIHPEDFRDRIGNIHGHLHTKILNDKRYYNICLDQIGMNYIEYDQVRSELMLLERN